MALIDQHVSTLQCKRAVDALLAHASMHEERKAESQLLPGKEQHVWLVVNTKVMYPEKKIKPVRISVKHPIVDPRTTPVCLITKDPQREYKDLLATLGIKFISRVVDIRHLKGKWKPFEARRMLLKENGLFLADDRVVPLLPSLLGKPFFQAKKQPIPVCITRKDLKAELERAISSTYFHQNQGTCTSIKIGTVSQKPAQVLANLETALPEIVKHIKGEWDNIQSMLIKTNSSAALPIWQCALGAEPGARWNGLVADHSGDENVDDVEDQRSSITSNEKGKKRAVDTDVEEVNPKKKARGSENTGKPMAAKTAETSKPKKIRASPADLASDPQPTHLPKEHESGPHAAPAKEKRKRRPKKL